MKRSNRLVLLVGVFLAIVAFIAILVLQTRTPTLDPNAPVTELPTVIAATDIPLGTRVQANQVKVETVLVGGRDAGAYQDPSQVIGKIVRQPVTAGAQITSATFGLNEGTVLDITCPAGLVCMAVQVDQVTGVGTVIKSGDYVDMVVGFTGDKFPVITVNPADDTFTVVAGLNSTSVKALVQGMQVLGTLLPPPPAAAEGAPPPEDGGTALTGQQQIVIVAATTQQAEVIKFAQLDGSISLVLRSPEDFIDPVTGEPLPAVVPTETTGVILKVLVDTYGVLPPELVETVLPEQSPAP
ncbi:MAG: Flp pilus assembly protein CpaB [Chloroflexota bacterium]